jgi:hypothetical protein
MRCVTALVRIALAFGAMATSVISNPVMAQERVGVTATIRKDVSRERGTSVSPLGVGENLVRDEAVRTGVESAAKIVLIDETNLAIGASSRVKLDKYVVAGPASASQVGISLAKGAMRFMSGNSDKRAYEITTPTVTLGVRGTVLEIRADGNDTTVVLVEGSARMCLRAGGGCIELERPGQTVHANARAARHVPTNWRFSGCNANPGLCGRTRFADADRAGQGERAAQIVLASFQQAQNAPAPPQPVAPQAASVPWVGGVGGIDTSLDAPNLGLFFTFAKAGQTAPPVAGSAVQLQSANSFLNGTTSPATLDGIVRVEAGYQYTAWGEWNGSLTFQDGSREIKINRGYFVLGQTTPENVVSSKTGTASYTGTLHGDFAPLPGQGAIQTGAITGNVQLAADFGSRTIGGQFNMALNGASWASAQANGTFQSGGGIVGFSGSLASFGSPNSFGGFGGFFYGPNAQEIGGGFSYFKGAGNSGVQGLASGVFVGR